MPPVHRPRCQAYRRAYAERYGRAYAAVCCCSSDDDEPDTAPRKREIPTVDMPCVWCLLWLNTAPDERPFRILAHPYGATADTDAQPIAVTSWAQAEELRYGSQYHLRDEYGTYFGLDAKTLVGGDAVCIPHAVSNLRARVGR